MQERSAPRMRYLHKLPRTLHNNVVNMHAFFCFCSPSEVRSKSGKGAWLDFQGWADFAAFSFVVPALCTYVHAIQTKRKGGWLPHWFSDTAIQIYLYLSRSMLNGLLLVKKACVDSMEWVRNVIRRQDIVIRGVHTELWFGFGIVHGRNHGSYWLIISKSLN